MRKKYQKPQILFEDMTFNTAISACTAQIATGCQTIDTDKGPVTPTEMEGEDLIFFIKGIIGCEMEFECYHVPNHFDNSQLATLS